MTCKHNNGTTASDNCADCERDRLKDKVKELEAEVAEAKLQAPLGYKPTIEEVIELHKQPYREVWHPDFMDCALAEIEYLNAIINSKGERNQQLYEQVEQLEAELESLKIDYSKVCEKYDTDTTKLEAEVAELKKEIDQYTIDNYSANPAKWHIRGDDYQKVRNENKRLEAEVEQLNKIVGIRENSAHFQWAKGRIDELEVACIANGAFIKELEAEVERLRGCKFSDRMYAVLKEKAELWDKAELMASMCTPDRTDFIYRVRDAVKAAKGKT